LAFLAPKAASSLGSWQAPPFPRLHSVSGDFSFVSQPVASRRATAGDVRDELVADERIDERRVSTLSPS
jgi:hypothetical protein